MQIKWKTHMKFGISSIVRHGFNENVALELRHSFIFWITYLKE